MKPEMPQAEMLSGGKSTKNRPILRMRLQPILTDTNVSL
jgi:hypothetical protein